MQSDEIQELTRQIDRPLQRQMMMAARDRHEAHQGV
jgi:hypothetical protein